MIVRAFLTLAASLVAGSAMADVPPPIPLVSYYGPVCHCGDGFALEARTGEGLIVLGEVEAALRIGQHHLGVSRATSGYTLITDPAIIARTGTLMIDGVGAFARYRVSAGQPNDARVTYLFDPGGGVDSVRGIEISSDLLEGNEKDRTVLARVALGEQARRLCASVPEALRPTPERARYDAMMMRQPRYSGPLTVCWGRVAFDVVAGEAVVLPWNPDTSRFALIMSGLEVGIAGDFRVGGNLDGALPAGVIGPLLPFAMHFTLAAGTRGTGVVVNEFMREGVPVINRARLLANADIKTIGPEPGPGLTFSFSRPVPDARRDAVIGRVRARLPTNHCFDPEQP